MHGWGMCSVIISTRRPNPAQSQSASPPASNRNAHPLSTLSRVWESLMFRGLYKLFLAGALTVALLVAWTSWFAISPMSMGGKGIEFSIKQGSSLRGATRQMMEAGIPLTAWQFNLLARVNGAGTSIKAGSYLAEDGISPWDLLGKITRGEFSMAEVVFIEGWTFAQMRSALRGHPSITNETASMTDVQVVARLGLPGVHPEGWFFPDTYLFPKGTSDLTILELAHSAMRKQLESAWQGRKQGLPLRTEYEALILASIVEKETGRREDRPHISAVFLNRLRLGMRLQTDPTVIYGMGDRFDGNLRRRDLVTDGPFNTYLRSGLPPRPIAMPGRESLQAVMHPAQTDALYFVARGDGSSEFSRTLDEHNRAVRRFQLRR
jgi:UPF0755 protein